MKREKYYSCEEAFKETFNRRLNDEHNTRGTVRTWQSVMIVLEEIGETD